MNSAAQDLIGKHYQELIDSMNLSTTNTQTQDDLLAQVGNNILDRIAYEILEKLPAQAREHALNLFDAGNLSELSQYLSQQIPDIAVIIKAAAEDELMRARLVVSH